MNVAMWGRALRIIPRLSKDEWDGLDFVSRCLIATRAAVLVMTFLSAAIAGILAARIASFDWRYWALLTVGLVLAHAANNLFNDLTDFRRGVDRDNYFRAQYGPQPLTHGFMTKAQSRRYAVVTLLLGIAAGAYLIVVWGLPALILLAAGLFFVLFYTFPLKFIGLGEIAVLVVWGPLMIGGGFYVITGLWSWNVVLAGLPYALGVTGVIFGKHIDKVYDDRGRGIRTVPALIGERASRVILLVLTFVQYALVIYLVVTRFFTPAMLITLLAVPMLVTVSRVYSRSKPLQCPVDYPSDSWPLWFVGYAFLHNRRFGSLFLLGLIADTVLIRTGIFALAA